MANEKLTIFDLLTDISFTKSGKMLQNPDYEKLYNPFMINRFLSMDASTVMQANFMNRFWNLPKKNQYQFLTNSIDKKKRFFQFKKAEKVPEERKVIQEYFQVNASDAQMIMKFLTEDQVTEIVKKYANKVRKR